METPKGAWRLALELSSSRAVCGGDVSALTDSIRRGADLCIGTDFRHNKHIDTLSDNREIIRETTEFAVTYLLRDRWAAGLVTQRMPVTLLGEDGFGPRAGASFFLYNQDGQQALANLFFEEAPVQNASPSPPPNMPKYHLQQAYDIDSATPSCNFIYDFDHYSFYVRDDWQEVYTHDADGSPLGGSIEELLDAIDRGAELKLGIRNLCSDLCGGIGNSMEHEVFVRVGSRYHYCERQILFAGTHPLVRVAPAIPLHYSSGGWDFGSLLVRTDGRVGRWLCEPGTRRFRKSMDRCAVRWFVWG